MLVLTRKLGELIHVGEDVVIQVVAIEPGKRGAVRLGITAPREVLIDRAEVRRRREADQRRATT